MELMTEQEVLKSLAERQRQGEKIVFTNGCFDIMHRGHVRYLRAARALGDALVVGLNSDESVRRLKGPSRPIIPVEERAEVLLALKPVDYVLVFEQDTPFELIKTVKPNVLVKGGDWPVESIVGADVVLASGGEVRSLEFVQGCSTTNVIEKIRSIILQHG